MGLPNYPSADSIRAALLVRADALALKAGLSRSAISKSALNDPSFLQKVADGENFTVRSYERLMSWIDAHTGLQIRKVFYKRQPTIVKRKARMARPNMRNGGDTHKTKRRRSRI